MKVVINSSKKISYFSSHYLMGFLEMLKVYSRSKKHHFSLSEDLCFTDMSSCLLIMDVWVR